MNKPRDEQGKFTATNPSAWARKPHLPQYHPAHASSQVNLLLRRIVAAKGGEVLLSDVHETDVPNADINDLLRQIVAGADPQEGTE